MGSSAIYSVIENGEMNQKLKEFAVHLEQQTLQMNL